MGYYTEFNLQVRHVRDIEEFNRLSRAIQQHPVMKCAFDKPEYDPEKQEVTANALHDLKWYEYAADMSEFSLDFPEMIFRIAGYGEDRMDMWNAFFMNGENECCYARIEFDKPKSIPWDGETDLLY